ncbi:outer membrane protein transport protein [Jannaschia ovalis]|uniref:Outer membrane protein transport protein n=1 Tax=Jannaschia ovalis TaxID=3038773 RepID=A0ABY8LAK4_9RHOB|nr:outer membrane protein transport protein [Jannaschia sp. GRR-S6-38]WGH78336.1 outer membrane protein transport protein [Jannaschia sp. GRR-S6-38]
MNRFALAAAATIAATASAQAGGLDRSGQSILALFDAPDTGAATLSWVNPSVTGSDTAAPTGATYDVGNSYSQVSLSFANEINDRVSYAVIVDQPFGADIFYNATPQTSLLGGTKADLGAEAVTVLGKYQFSDRVSAYGGVRVQRAGGEVALNGQAYAQAIGTALEGRGIGTAGPNAADLLTPNGAGFTGYDVQIDESWGAGLVIGAAYEIPEIALRLAVTYNSKVTHSGDSVERFSVAALGDGAPLAGQYSFQTPQSINIDFQTGINPKTLVLASLRWTEWGDFDVVPQNLNADLANIDDVYRWSVGVARRFSDEFVGLASVTYEKDNGSATVSPLGPTDGQIGVNLGARYDRGNLAVSGGINYTEVGDAFAGVGGNPVALFSDNSVVGVGFKVAYKF